MNVLHSAQEESFVRRERQIVLLGRYPTLFAPFYERHWKALSVAALAALLFLSHFRRVPFENILWTRRTSLNGLAYVSA